jgi:hypothetical protein
MLEQQGKAILRNLVARQFEKQTVHHCTSSMQNRPDTALT